MACLCAQFVLLGFKFNDEEAAKVNEAKKMQKWVSRSLGWRSSLLVLLCLLVIVSNNNP